jgi:hypothetical protein
MIDFNTEEHDMVWRVLLVSIFLVQMPWMTEAQVKPAHQPVVDLPRGAVSRVPSPDGKWTLIFECPNDCSERKLWIEENTSHRRKLVKEYDRSLSISWAPDSRLFFVNDASGSTETLCYVYEPATLKETDLAKVVVAGDPKAAQFLNVGHSYLSAKRWINSRELLVVLYGHSDEPPPRGFTLRYRVNLNGNVRKLSQHSEEEPQ